MRLFRSLCSATLGTSFVCGLSLAASSAKDVPSRVEALIGQMTLEEKIGQMTQVSNFWDFTGPMSEKQNAAEKLADLKAGRIGSMLNLTGVDTIREAQRNAVENSRLRIPLVFGYDVIHGYKVIFPEPLAESASWDLALMERTARVAAIEASAAGLNWTFAPMVDIARDPRWGRIMEGAGEDTWLGCQIAKARVRGFQGGDLAATDTIAACAKHYAAYGAAEGGRDYNHCEMSEQTLRNVYLPPFKAAADAGAATFMSAFNSVLGMPAAGSKKLGDILKVEWKYPGMVVSDWTAIKELIPHGVARDAARAAELGIKAGCDMEMVSDTYRQSVPALLASGRLTEAQINDAVRRILTFKFNLGLFDDPYRYCDKQRETGMIGRPEFFALAREAAQKSIVLLKNERAVLPLSEKLQRIAIIGPLGDDKDAPIGNWRAQGKDGSAVSLKEGLATALPKVKLVVHQGCAITAKTDKPGFAAKGDIIYDDSRIPAAVKAARDCDLVILAVGEEARMAGEARSRGDIRLPGAQEKLVEEIAKLGKPVVLVLFNGRPLDLSAVVGKVDAIVEAWHLGSESGNAIADILTGKVNSSGKLTATFPFTVGQIPMYYNHTNTGRPDVGKEIFESKYMDIPNKPVFPFGFGLSYTTFKYAAPRLSANVLLVDGTLTVSVDVTNTGKRAGEEIVQFYIRNRDATCVLPVKELKGFKKVAIEPGATVTVEFKLSKADLMYYDAECRHTFNTGLYEIMTGPSSAEVTVAEFEMK